VTTTVPTRQLQQPQQPWSLRTPRTSQTDRRMRGPATAVTAGFLAVFAAGCAAAPTAPPQIPPTAGTPVSTTAAAVHHDARITLPVTVGLAFHHPALSDRTEYEVLFTVQQAMRAMVQAEYSVDTRDSQLAQYWSGAGLAAVDAQIKQWTANRQQPVGVIVLENTGYTAASGHRAAAVGFCADWSDVVRGEARTHVVGTAVQAKGVRPTYEQLALERAADRRWRVVSVQLSADSPRCN